MRRPQTRPRRESACCRYSAPRKIASSTSGAHIVASTYSITSTIGLPFPISSAMWFACIGTAARPPPQPLIAKPLDLQHPVLPRPRPRTTASSGSPAKYAAIPAPISLSTPCPLVHPSRRRNSDSNSSRVPSGHNGSTGSSSTCAPRVAAASNQLTAALHSGAASSCRSSNAPSPGAAAMNPSDEQPYTTSMNTASRPARALRNRLFSRPLPTCNTARSPPCPLPDPPRHRDAPGARTPQSAISAIKSFPTPRQQRRPCRVCVGQPRCIRELAEPTVVIDQAV